MKFFEKENNNEKISFAIIHLLIEIGTRGIGRFVHGFIYLFFFSIQHFMNAIQNTSQGEVLAMSWGDLITLLLQNCMLAFPLRSGQEPSSASWRLRKKLTFTRLCPYKDWLPKFHWLSPILINSRTLRISTYPRRQSGLPYFLVFCIPFLLLLFFCVQQWRQFLL